MKQARQETTSASWPVVILEILALGAAITAAFIGSGAMGGTPIQEAAGGYLSADSTLLAPSGPAFSIWSVIYLGLAVFAIYQALPQGRRSQTLRAVRVPVAASALLNAAWIAVVQLDQLLVSTIVIFILLGVLIWILLRLVNFGTASRAEHWIMWLTFGLYLGWVSVASIANTSALLSSWNVGIDTAWAPYAAVVLLLVAAIIGLGVTGYTHGKIYTALAMTWGIAWIGHSRLTGTNQSTLVGYAALVIAAALLIGALAIAFSQRHRTESSRP
ncbi:TspO/MBR family protein [Glutamicibacter sp. BW77]|uniref:TspO/MBR family protein n=1 Tax=Glutamicibacter TaxID=1742989 RepID=UPI00197AF42D|nr:TspO/MBR family protein [Glutamicibacter sp. BW77]